MAALASTALATIVLVHVQNPATTLADDVAATKRVIPPPAQGGMSR